MLILKLKQTTAFDQREGERPRLERHEPDRDERGSRNVRVGFESVSGLADISLVQADRGKSHVSRNIGKRRPARVLTQTEVAKLFRCSPGTVSKWVHQKKIDALRR